MNKGETADNPLPIEVPGDAPVKAGERFSMKVPCDPASGRMLCGSGPPFPPDGPTSVMLDRWFVAVVSDDGTLA